MNWKATAAAGRLGTATFFMTLACAGLQAQSGGSPPPAQPSVPDPRWGVFSQLDGTHWATHQGTAIHHIDSYWWERPGEALLSRHTGPGYDTQSRWVLGADGSITRTNTLQDGTSRTSTLTVQNGEIVQWNAERTARSWMNLSAQGVLIEGYSGKAPDGTEQNSEQPHARVADAVATEWRVAENARFAERQQRAKLLGPAADNLTLPLRSLDGKISIGRAIVLEDGRMIWDAKYLTFEGTGAGRYQCTNSQKPCSGAFKADKGTVYFMPDDGTSTWLIDCNAPGYCRLNSGVMVLTPAGFREPSVRILADQQAQAASQAAQQRAAQIAQQQAAARAANEARWAAEDAEREREEREDAAERQAMNAAMMQGMASILTGRPASPSPAPAYGAPGGYQGSSGQGAYGAPAAPTPQERRCMAGEIYRWDGDSWVHTFQKCTEGGGAQQQQPGYGAQPDHAQPMPQEGERRCMGGEISRWERNRWLRTFVKC